MELVKRGVVFTHILLATLHVSASDIPGKASDILNQANAIGKDLAKTIENLYETKSMVKVIAPASDSKEITELIGIAKLKVQTMVSDTITELKAMDQDNSDLVAGAIGNSMTGLVGMVNGIRNSNWVEGVQGALGLVAAIASLAGPGLGAIASAVLSAVSTFLGLLGGSEPESQEGMVKRVVETAISESRNKDLKEDVEGVQHVYQSLSTAIQQFRESTELTSFQADQLYMTVFQELSVFGRLKTRIAELCAKCDTDLKAGNCIDFAKLYAELSVLRQLIMTDLASLLSSVKLKASPAKNILKIIRKEQENDLKTLAFLGSPINHPRQRWAFALMFAQPDKFSTLISYLNALDKTSNFGFWDHSLIICSGAMLQGGCVPFEKLKNFNYVPSLLGIFDTNIKSFFVPPSGQALFWQNSQYTGKQFGPFTGPALYGNIGEDQYGSLKYLETDDDNKGSIRFCGENAKTKTEVQCDYWNFPEYSDEEVATDLSKHHGHHWVGKIASFYVPPGLSLEAISQKDDQFGPYIGPYSFNKLCESKSAKSTSWKTIVVKRISDDAMSMVEFCDEEDLKGACFRSATSLATLTDIYGQCDFTNKIRSIKIPAGYSVRGFKLKDYEQLSAGPYFGPITIGKVDQERKWGSVQVNSDINFFLSTRALGEHPLTDSNFVFQYARKKIDWKEFDRNQTVGRKVESLKNVHKKLED